MCTGPCKSTLVQIYSDFEFLQMAYENIIFEIAFGFQLSLRQISTNVLNFEYSRPWNPPVAHALHHLIEYCLECTVTLTLQYIWWYTIKVWQNVLPVGNILFKYPNSQTVVFCRDKIYVSYTLGREYRVMRNRYSRLLFTSEVFQDIK